MISYYNIGGVFISKTQRSQQVPKVSLVGEIIQVLTVSRREYGSAMWKLINHVHIIQIPKNNITMVTDAPIKC